STRLGLTPEGLYEPLLLEAMEDRIKHPVGPFEATVRELAHALDDLVAVTVAPLQDRQDERRRGRGDQLFRHRPSHLQGVSLTATADTVRWKLSSRNGSTGLYVSPNALRDMSNAASKW